MTTFTEIIDKFRREAWSERDKGFRFERLMQAYLKTTTLYAGRFEEIWLWTEFPYHDQFGGQDLGIDLVAKTFAGEYWAVQCKCYADDKYITKADVDTFLSTSGKTFEIEGEEHVFAQRLWISTTNKWNSAAELTIKNQTLHVQIKSSVLKQDLMMSRSNIIKRLNEYVKANVITEIIFH